MFWDTFVRLCAEKGVSPTTAAKSIGASSAMVTKWRSGAIPRNNTIKKLSEYFLVDPNEFTVKNEVHLQKNGEGLTEQEEVLIELFRETDEITKAKIIVTVEEQAKNEAIRTIVEKIILYRPDNRLVIIFHDF